MHRGLLVSAMLALLVALFGTASALPPDFFRNGRGDLLPQKRTSWESDMIAKSCHFCSYISPNYDFECRKNIGNRRRECIMAYKIEFDDYVNEKGWK